MERRIRVKTFTLSRAELERYLIAEGEPEDIVITGITKPMNQEAWLITAQSSEYPSVGDFAVLPTQLNSIIKEKI